MKTPLVVHSGQDWPGVNRYPEQDYGTPGLGPNPEMDMRFSFQIKQVSLPTQYKKEPPEKPSSAFSRYSTMRPITVQTDRYATINHSVNIQNEKGRKLPSSRMSK